MTTTTCPKCGTEQPAGDACRRCGLVYAKWTAPEDARLEQEADETDETLGLWKACEDDWGAEARHTSFLLHCRREGRLPFAAGRYRAALKTRGADDPVAAARLQELAKLAEFAARAEATKDATRRAGDKPPYKGVTAVLVGGIVLLLAGAAFLWFLKVVR